MRILNIRFKNLNSLVGEWAIDLSHPAFAADGIFAITGPTGAGKTTILDAVCLALYGRTPRLNRVTKSGNEIMSRQTGECFAEVTFETQAGRFRCHWSQHRARKKPGGELQPPRHEIVDAGSGQVLEANLRGVAEQIEIATGMDFNRFTRSMLLAQGGFAAFLQAASDERAPILEQITGTEIYSRISIRVHERRSEAQKKHDALKAEMAGMQLLSEEDERQLDAVLAQRLFQESELNRLAAQHRQSAAWLDGIMRLEQELTLVEAQQQEWRTRQAAFEPQREKLQRATQALELAGEHAGVAALRRAQQADRQNLSRCLPALAAQVEQVKGAEAALKLAGESLEKQKTALKEGQPVIRRTRELDLKLREKDKPITAARERLSGQEKTLNALRTRHEETQRVLRKRQQGLADVLQRCAQTMADEGLVEHLAGIRSRCDALQNLHDRCSSGIREVKAAEAQRQAAARVWTERRAILEDRQRACEAVRSALDQKRTQLKALLADREIADWRNHLSALKERKVLLEKTGEAVRSHSDARRTLGELGRCADALASRKTALAGQLGVQTERHAALEREMHLLETQHSLLKKIQAFEAARHQLRDGEPCPLCGAIEHPFARGNIPPVDETAAALGRVRADLKAAYDAAADLRVRLAEAAKDLELTAARQKECTERIAVSEALMLQGAAALSIEFPGQEVEPVLAGRLKENEDELNRSAIVVQAAETLERELGRLRETHEKAMESVTQSERETQKAVHSMESAAQLHERAGREVEVLGSGLQTAQGELLREVSAYGIVSLCAETLDTVLQELAARRTQWLARQKKKSDHEQEISSLGIQIRHQEEQIGALDSELGEQRELLNGLMREREELHHARRELFGGRRPDEEESRLCAAVEAAEKDRDRCRQTLDRALQELARLQSQIEALEKSMAVRAAQLKAAEAEFTARLAASGFADEAGYAAACLPEAERSKLLRKAQDLAGEQTELASRLRDKKDRLETERRKQVTDQSREALEQAVSALDKQLRDLQQEIGGIRRKLEDNQSVKQCQQERARDVEAQKKECLRWDVLHELIGSADGKKYRNFAQGLTFEMMIGHANRQLQKMTDRYLLIRDATQPLELNVIDNYQAGEIRSTKNLSGGESFIVSLSLALGLSQMASRNVRVDSLFLDEGFGTLDDEALDTALTTLAGLRQDGKLIGLISHVPALRERIATRIQVVPQTGGRSVIKGPGCGPGRTAAKSIPE